MKAIPNFPNYSITKDGKVFNTIRGKELKLEVVRGGYRRIMLCNNGIRERFSVHRLVAIAYIDNPETKPQVNHINGITYDNRVENLEWCTQSENQIHAVETGLQKSSYGNSHYQTELDEKIVMDIRIEYSSSKISQLDLGLKYNLHQGTVGEIVRGETWKHVSGPIVRNKQGKKDSRWKTEIS